ncbi:MAG: hypothetical protein Q7S84_04940 [bacterium]|nr:hypothetical protein [bacterium]
MKRAALLVVSVTVALSALALSVAQAYEYRGPTQPFPQGNPAAPLDTGTNPQNRNAPLGFSQGGETLKFLGDQWLTVDNKAFLFPLAGDRTLLRPGLGGLDITKAFDGTTPAKVVVSNVPESGLCFGDTTPANCRNSWAGIGGGGSGDSYWKLNAALKRIEYVSSTNPSVKIGGAGALSSVIVAGNLTLVQESMAGATYVGSAPVYSPLKQDYAGPTPSFAWWQSEFSGEFGSAASWESIRITNANSLGGCEDTNMGTQQCEEGVTYQAAVGSPTKVYDLWREREDNGTRYRLWFQRFDRTSTGLGGGRLSAPQICLKGDCREQWPAANGDPYWTDRGDPTSFYTTAAHRVGIGRDPNPAYKLDVVGKVNSTEGFFKNGVEITGGGVGGNDPRWVDVTGGGGMHYEGGKVGIGTGTDELRDRVDVGRVGGVGGGVSVGDYLELGENVSGNTAFLGFNARLWASTDVAGGNKFKPVHAPGTGMVIAQSAGGFGNLQFWGIDWNGSAVEKVFPNDFTLALQVGANGRISVGTTDQGAKLAVNATGAAGKQGRAEDAIRAYANAPVGAALSAEQDNPAGYALYADGGKSYFGGNVGIGVQNPSANLHVGGTIKVGDRNSTDSKIIFGEGLSNSVTGFVTYTGSTPPPGTADTCSGVVGTPQPAGTNSDGVFQCSVGSNFQNGCADVAWQRTELVPDGGWAQRTVTCYPNTDPVMTISNNGGTLSVKNGSGQPKLTVAQNGLVTVNGPAINLSNTLTNPGAAAGLALNTAGAVPNNDAGVSLQQNGANKWSIFKGGGAANDLIIGRYPSSGFTSPLQISQATGKVTISDGLVLPTGAGLGKVLTSDRDGVANWQSPEVPPLPAVGEKLCRIIRSGVITDTINVSDLWARSTCRNYAVQQNTFDFYTLGCMTASGVIYGGSGSISAGTEAGLPNPNCGWLANPGTWQNVTIPDGSSDQTCLDWLSQGTATQLGAERRARWDLNAAGQIQSGTGYSQCVYKVGSTCGYYPESTPPQGGIPTASCNQQGFQASFSAQTQTLR